MINFVYALYSPLLNSIYIGQTQNIQHRIKQHNSGYSKYTSRTNDWILVYSEECATKSLALKREKQLKTAKGRSFIWEKVNNF